ncbi:MAG: histidine kinase [Clostridiaceae bacterium]
MSGMLARFLSMIRKMKLKQRLILFNIFSILIPVLVITYMFFVAAKSMMTDETVELSKNTISQVSSNIDDLIGNEVINSTNILMHEQKLYDLLRNGLGSGTDKEREKLIDVLLYRNEVPILSVLKDRYINIAALYGKNGELFNFSLPAANEQTVLDRLKQMGVLSGEKNYYLKWFPVQNNFFTTEKSGDIRQDYVAIASRVISNPKTGEYLGCQIYTICERAIYNTYSNIKLGKTGKIFIIDKNGDIVSNSNENELSGTNLSSDLITSILKTEDPVFHYNINRSNFLIITKASSENQWITVGMVPENEIFEKVNRIIKYAVLILLVSILTSLGFMIVTADGIVNPIRKLEKAMNEVENGNLSVSVDIKGDYEVSKLGRYFNGMINKINKLIQEEYIHERKRKEAELNVLMAQINPHFLYNTLDSIVWKARSMKAFEISEMASSLGRLFRISISKGNVMVYVEEELEHVQAYINIQRLRYGNRFDYVLDIPDDRVKKYKTLKLLLQPIVENSLSYGIEHIDKKGVIRIKAVQDGSKLVFEVSDNGIGIPEEKLKAVREKIYTVENIKTEEKYDKQYAYSTGIGFKNIHDRIRLYFGPEYGIRIESHENEGTTIYVTVPVLDKDI